MYHKCVNLLTKNINNDRIGEQDVTKLLEYVLILLENFMHNLISSNQLAAWKEIETSQELDDRELVNDYFNCLIECDDQNQSRRICKEILT